MGEQRYTIVPDGWDGGGAGYFEVFDNVEGRHIQGKRWASEDGAKAWIAVYGESSGKDDLDLEAEMEAKGNDAGEGEIFPLRGLQIVLDALAGQVKCSNCAKEYHGHNGSLAVGPAAANATTHSIKVTRYIGFDTPKLTVDLTCTICAHTGMYTFPGNPLIDGGEWWVTNLCESIDIDNKVK